LEFLFCLRTCGDLLAGRAPFCNAIGLWKLCRVCYGTGSEIKMTLM
jgi:hypothetical protein